MGRRKLCLSVLRNVRTHFPHHPSHLPSPRPIFPFYCPLFPLPPTPSSSLLCVYISSLAFVLYSTNSPSTVYTYHSPVFVTPLSSSFLPPTLSVSKGPDPKHVFPFPPQMLPDRLSSSSAWGFAPGFQHLQFLVERFPALFYVTVQHTTTLDHHTAQTT